MCNVVLLLLVLLITSAKTTTSTVYSEQFTSLALKQSLDSFAFQAQGECDKRKRHRCFGTVFVPQLGQTSTAPTDHHLLRLPYHNINRDAPSC